MSHFRNQVAKSLGDVLQQRLNLQVPPTIIAAAPSEVADYPSVAIWLERFSTIFATEEELQVDADGELMMGATASLGLGEDAAWLDSTNRLAKIGSFRGSGRIWVGSRLAPKREEVESEISLAFVQDSSAPGRLLISIQNPTIGRFVVPWAWTATVNVGNIEWTDEFAFSERLWAWIMFDIDIDMLVARSEPVMTQFRIAFDTEHEFPLLEVGAVEIDLAHTEHYTVTNEGVLVPYSPP